MSREISPYLPLAGLPLVAALTTGCLFNRAPDPIEPAPVAQAPASAETTPAAAPAPEPFALKADEQLVPHKVAKGDSLWELAQKYQTRVSRIKAANNLQSDMIVEGRTLQIPTTMGGGAVAAPATTAPAPPAVTEPAAAPRISLPMTPATTPAPAAPAPTPPAPAPTPAPAPAPSLNFGTQPTPPAPSGGGALQIQD